MLNQNFEDNPILKDKDSMNEYLRDWIEASRVIQKIRHKMVQKSIVDNNMNTDRKFLPNTRPNT